MMKVSLRIWPGFPAPGPMTAIWQGMSAIKSAKVAHSS